MNNSLDKYYDYLHDHISNVKRGYNWIQKNCPDLLQDISIIALRQLEYNIDNHDGSKYLEEELLPYTEYFYGNQKSVKVQEEFDLAWNHHQKTNSHHWQYWILINDDNKNKFIYLDMPYIYIIEMLCDWWAFSWMGNNLYEIFDWYADHKNHMLLSDNTRTKVENILTIIKNKLDQLSLEGLND